MPEIISKISATIKRRRVLLASVALLAAAGVAGFLLWGNKAAANDYITAKVDRGNVEVSVSATGTVQAVTTVQVGSQVSGTVQWLGADFNSQVKRGQVIARLDPAIFQAQVDNARANVQNQQAAIIGAQTEIVNQQANIKASQANVEVNRVQRDDALAVVRRYQELKTVIPSRDIEAAQATANAAAARYEQAVAQLGQVQAGLAQSKAKLDQAKAGLAQAQAQLSQQQANLDHSIIASPIDGVVVSRAVDIGQTVAASLQAPTLFTIANDLTKMQVLASIDEADVGQIKQGIKANFAVDAFPGETFTGEITQLRLNAQTTQNVVTYSAVIEVANPELKLRPGMTANITIPVARRDNVLTVPNAALRFKPTLSEKEQEALRQKMEERRNQRQAERQGAESQGQQPNAQGQQPAAQGQQPAAQDQAGGAQGQRRGRPGDGQSQPAQGEGNQPAAGAGSDGQRRGGQMVWVMVGDKQIEPRFVRTGLTNGRITEIIAGDLKEGETIVIGQNDASGNRPQQGGSPFQQRPGGGGGRGR
ncbi:MAG TPA: efflux RND transporter periplasmic adaptor subunit [Blastocatellia bacterium]|nr:efflux RND transporter periplasmic adaptor subunit [Blastocatellia bacterium]